MLRGRAPGAMNCFDAPIDPQLNLTQEQTEVIAILRQQLLLGFRNAGATEEEREQYEQMGAETNLAKLMTAMNKVLDIRASFCSENKQLTEAEVGHVQTTWMNRWILRELRLEQRSTAMGEKTNIFSAYVRQTFGGKAFVLAVIQWGST